MKGMRCFLEYSARLEQLRDILEGLEFIKLAEKKILTDTVRTMTVQSYFFIPEKAIWMDRHFMKS